VAALLANTRRAVAAGAARRAAVRVRGLGDGRRRRTDNDLHASQRGRAVAEDGRDRGGDRVGRDDKEENGHGIVSEPYHLGRAGKLVRAAKTCTAAGAGLTVVAGRTRLGAVASGTLLAAGSLLTRFDVFDAGMASAKDPKCTVIPQRERMASATGRSGPSVAGPVRVPSLRVTASRRRHRLVPRAS
jgi:hypothetical protein